MEKRGRARQARDYVIRRMRLAWWATKAIYTHSEYAILIAFPWKHGLRERVIRALPVFEKLPNPSTMDTSV